MSTLDCLIIEDEPLAADILCDYIAQTPGLRLKGVCADALKGMEQLRRDHVDLIFLDIHLPKLSGLDLVRTLGGEYQIILTTAHHEHALEGFELNVADYLLKPIAFTRFVQAVNKVFARRGLLPAAPEQAKHYFFNVDRNRVKALADDIRFIESLRDYVHIHTDTGKIITKFRIGELGAVLHDPRFLRIHKSYIVNLDKVLSHNATTVTLSGCSLPVGRNYKKDLALVLNKKQV